LATLTPPIANAITLAPGDILVTDFGGTSRIDPHTGVVTPFSDVGGHGISYGAGRIYVTTFNELIRVDRNTGEGTVVSSGGLFTDLRSVAVARNGDVYVLNTQSEPFFPASVILVNPATGSQTLVASGITLGASDLAIAPDGSIWVATRFGVIWRVDPSTGDFTEIADTNHDERIDINEHGAVMLGGRSHFHVSTAVAGGFLDEEFESVIDVALGPGLQLYVSTSQGNLYHAAAADFGNDPVLIGPEHLLAEITGSSFITVVTPMPGSLLLVLVVGIGVCAARRLGVCSS
jgi:streptogramin lyase